MNDYINTLNRLTERIKILLVHLNSLYDITDEEERNLRLSQTALDGELIAKNLRKLLIQASTVERSETYHQICVTDGYEVRREGDITIITMPPLPLKERSYTNYQYFIDPLMHCLETYTAEHHPEKYNRCLLRIKHIFPESTPLRLLHDYDNREVKKVIDAIALHLLIDDNIRKCQVHYMGEVGDTLQTEVWIFPLDDGDKNTPKS